MNVFERLRAFLQKRSKSFNLVLRRSKNVQQVNLSVTGIIFSKNKKSLSYNVKPVLTKKERRMKNIILILILIISTSVKYSYKCMNQICALNETTCAAFQMALFIRIPYYYHSYFSSPYVMNINQ